MTEREMIQADLAATRDRIGSDIAELRNRLTPSHLAGNAAAAVGEAAVALPAKPIGRGVIAAILGSAALWGLLMLTRSKGSA